MIRYKRHNQSIEVKPDKKNLYYHVLADNERQVFPIIENTWASFAPIKEYLDRSIEAEKKRSIGASFEIVYEQKRLYLKKQTKKIELLSEGILTFNFDENWYEIINAEDFDQIPLNRGLSTLLHRLK